jgi:hypothetical protein
MMGKHLTLKPYLGKCVCITSVEMKGIGEVEETEHDEPR